MRMKSLLYAANSNAQTVVAGNSINFGNVVRKFGNNLNMSGGNIIESGAGYYAHDAHFRIAGTTAGEFAIQMYQDGVAIQGAIATVTTAAGSEHNLTIPFVTRTFCCRQSEISAVVAGVTADVVTASIVSEKA